MKRFLTKGALTGVLVSTALMATACPDTAPVYGGPPTGNRTFQATSVTVNSDNDGFAVNCFSGCDEPRVLNIGFRVKIGVANSADAQVVYGDNHWPGLIQQGLESGESLNYTNGERGALTFNNVALPDILDLAQGAPVEIAGVWAWKVEDDGVLSASPAALANAIASALESVLNTTVATSTLPADPNAIVGLILGAIGNVNFFTGVWAGISTLLPGIVTDDIVGSAMYIGVGSSGALASIIDGATSGVAFPNVQIPLLSWPPDIGGGSIFSLGVGTKTFSNGYTNAGISGQHTTAYTFG
jgi:hypothetical protein